MSKGKNRCYLRNTCSLTLSAVLLTAAKSWNSPGIHWCTHKGTRNDAFIQWNAIPSYKGRNPVIYGNIRFFLEYYEKWNNFRHRKTNITWSHLNLTQVDVIKVESRMVLATGWERHWKGRHRGGQWSQTTGKQALLLYCTEQELQLVKMRPCISE